MVQMFLRGAVNASLWVILYTIWFYFKTAYSNYATLSLDLPESDGRAFYV